MYVLLARCQQIATRTSMWPDDVQGSARRIRQAARRAGNAKKACTITGVVGTVLVNAVLAQSATWASTRLAAEAAATRLARSAHRAQMGRFWTLALVKALARVWHARGTLRPVQLANISCQSIYVS